MATRPEIRILKEAFKKDYANQSPFDLYINGVGIRPNPNGGLEDYVLGVYLKEKPPADVKLPRQYQGVEIIYDIISEIKPRKI